jgi:DHA3 family macrolide efflux protein-like MFS transporter
MPHQDFLSRHWQKQALLFLLSQNLSLFGSSAVGFSLVWHITLQTTSGFWMMLATIACNVPQILLLPWGGVWADRYERRRLIIYSDGFVAVVTLALALAFLGGLENLWLLMGALALRSLGSGVHAPASAALYPQIIPAVHLNRVQGINQTINAAVMLLSPAAGGLFLANFSLAWIMMADVMTAAMAIMVMRWIRAVKLVPAAQKLSVGAAMRHGLAYTLGHPGLRLLLFCYGAFFFLVTPAAVLTPLMIARTFGGEVWRLTANELVWSGLSVAGGIFISRRREFSDKPKVIAACVIFFGLTFAAMGLSGSFWFFLVLMGAAGFFMPVFMTASTVFIQQTAPPEVLGRVFSITQIISSGALPAAILLFGPLADIIAVEIILLGSGVLMLAAGLVYYIKSQSIGS